MQVRAAYAAPDRGYHDVEHLREVLQRLDEIVAAEPAYPVDLTVTRLAAFFHDAVYATSPGAEVSNEEASARWAQEALEPWLPAPDVNRVAALVRATYDHRAPAGDHEAAALMDADLAILAAPPERYVRYVAGVRREYAWVPEPQLRAGRAQVLTDLVGRAHVFHTGYARREWEQAARVNVARELVSLGDSSTGAD